MEFLVRVGLGVYLLFVGLVGVQDYQLLRWIIFLGVGYLLFLLWKREGINSGINGIYLWAYVIIIILFNPIIPIYLYDRSTWIIIDLVAAVTIIIKPILVKRIQ